MKKSTATLAAAMLFCGLASPATAATYSLTYSGSSVTIAEDGEYHYADIEDFSLAGAITDVNVTVNIDHYYPQDLDIYLAHSVTGDSGTWTYVQLYNNEIGGAFTPNLHNVTFDDQAATSISSEYFLFDDRTFKPGSYANDTDADSNMLSYFNGDPAAGIWSLVLFDGASGDIGTLQSFQVDIETDAAPQTAVPLPGAVVFLGLGLGALAAVRRS